MTTSSFSDNIEANKSAERVPVNITSLETPDGSRLDVRQRGCFVTDFSVIDELTGQRVAILYSDSDLETAKLTASHIMSPVGPSEGIGGQHGFPRWADYHEFMQEDGIGGEKLVSFQAERSDVGRSVSKFFDLDHNSLVTSTTITNESPEPIHTSLGEHLYFALQNESTDGLLLDGQTLDEKFGAGTEASVMGGDAYFWADYPGKTEVTFPAGHVLTLNARVAANQDDPHLGMLIWHRPGSPSICFEPTAGFESMDKNTELQIDAHEEVSLFTSINVHSSSQE